MNKLKDFQKLDSTAVIMLLLSYYEGREFCRNAQQSV